MGARYVYRAVEDSLHSELGKKELPHTRISRELRFALREHIDFAKIYMTRCVSVASFSGVVPETRAACLREYDSSMRDLLDTIPYVQAPKRQEKPQKSVEEERLEAIAKFNDMQK